ncbi:MAG TPA: L,D-transpeptidase [Chitinophagaceae bacterium]|nr:L,D-transpeptidase [Chitinophagaceae bacterium]
MKRVLFLVFVYPFFTFLLLGFAGKKNILPFSLKSSAKEKNIFPYSKYSVIIDKSDYELRVYDNEGWVATYPVVFGNVTLADKKMEGDRNTPEGVFHIIAKKSHREWGKFMLIDYPNEESFEKFKWRKLTGQIPSYAKIGGGIGIHGTRRNEEFAVDRYQNWTWGCISLKYSDIFELDSLLPVGTKITIQK